MKFVCPQPGLWHEIHQKLESAWKAQGSLGTPPPIPLILSGWAFSTDFEKHQRWLDTITWAGANNLSNLIPELDETDKYFVEEFSSYVWPSFGEQHHEPKDKPSENALHDALQTLQHNWENIVGHILAEKTYPIKFSGMKRRRLVVSADAEYAPPWGSWHWATRDKNSFTEFRASVNRALSPLSVDHIDFVFPLRREKK